VEGGHEVGMTWGVTCGGGEVGVEGEWGVGSSGRT
jgi:hypothetical protein